MKDDILGQALLDYQNGNYTVDIKTYSSLDEEDTMPLPYLFRSYQEMPKLEKQALELCKGKVLDIGCGAGSHSLYLQEKGFEVLALDSSQGAMAVCKQRGVKNALCIDFMAFENEKFDTLLLLMNGIGLAGRLTKLDEFFTKLKSLLKTDGQILLDSSDIIYMFDQDEDEGYWIPDEKNYYGEVDFYLEYKGQKSKKFTWLYLDFNTLRRAAENHNFNCALICEGEHYDYLARLTFKK